jgi:UDP-2,3-diacylglucosamine hydrolase
MSSTYFISDVHLGLESKEKELQKLQKLCAFLDVVLHNGKELFLLGDLFDVWFEYKTVIPKGHHRILTKLEDMTRAKIPVHFLVGNHDYWMGNYCRDELGINIYYEPFEKIIDGKKIYFHHGDGLALRDTGYRILKKILRNPLLISLYKLLHPDIGIALASGSSKQSRVYTTHKDYGEMDGMLLFAQQKFREGFDIVMMGHAHQSKLVNEDGHLYVNLGDWIQQCTYGEIQDGVFQLQHWGQ